MANKASIPPIEVSPSTVVLTGRGEESSDEGAFPVEYCSDENPDSVQNVAPVEFAKMLDYEEVWQLLVKNSEYELQKKVKPSAEQNRLRMAFWREYERAIQVKDKMDPENIYRGIMPKENFYRIVKKEPRVVAWILKQPTNYVNQMEEALNFSMHRVREILEMPLYKNEKRIIAKPDGTSKEMMKRVPNVPMAKLMLDVMKMLDQRVKGAIVQRVKQEVKTESKSFTANLDIGSETKSLADIDAEIKKLSISLDE